MTEEQWNRVEQLFEAAIELPADQQEGFVLRETSADPDLRQRVLGMLTRTPHAASHIIRSIENIAQAAVPGVGWEGREFGPYRIVREIAHGGMGTVFEALREDGEYRKRVALKIAPGWSDAGLMHERLRHERQILAGLEHPNIARFLDGGTEGGVPYIVMEYVEGVPITGYCRELPLEQRIRIFRQICDAVQHAHESMIVHRDLKPANILVAQDSVPKLLDFGIAKILSPVTSGADTTGAHWTPDYSSPEQVRGRPVTIRTDVYALGLILYEILCGERAQVADTSSPLAVDRSICEHEPPPPSLRAGDRALRKRLAGDLDTIVAMATRKEPERRYGSAAGLSADLGRYLDGEPVKARPGGFIYRTGKLVRRHRTAAVAVLVAAASLTAGVVTTVHQKRRAERRFAQVRKLADTFVFDVHDRIENLPGATEARKFIVQTALEYLENLRQDSAGDASLSLEIASAYEKIGTVQGSPSVSNLGDTGGALVSFGHARDILTPLAAQEPTARLPLASVHYKLGGVLRVRGEIQTAMANYAQSRALCETLLAESPRNRALLDLAGQLYTDINLTQTELRDAKAAADAAASAMDIAKRLVALNPADRLPRNALANASMNLGRAQLILGKVEESAAEFRESVRLREQLADEAPQDVVYRRELMVAYGTLGDVLGLRTGENLGDIEGAAAAFRKALDIAIWLREKDPADNKAKVDFASASLRLGSILIDDPGHAGDGVRHMEETARGLAELIAGDRKNARLRYLLMYVNRRMGEGLDALGHENEAVVALDRAAAMAPELIAGSDGPGAREQLALVMARLALIEAKRRNTRALELARALVAQIAATPNLFHVPWIEQTVYHDLGSAYLRMGQPGEAGAFLEKSLQRLQSLKLPAALEPRRQRELASLEADLASARR